MPDKLIVVRLNAQTGQYQAEMAAAARQTAGFATSVGASAGRVGGQVSNLGRVASNAGKFITLGVAGGLALSAKAAIDFESSFAGVQKTLDATPAQFSRLSDQIRGLAKEIPISVNELNRIAELGGQLGISVDGIVNFTDTIAKLGVTTTLATEDAAIGLARLANILGVSDTEFENVGSSLVDLGNNFATTEDQILTFALRIAPVGATVGLTADQVLALATAFSSVGVPAERGGTAVQKAFISMAEAVATAGDELDVFAKVAGITAEEFAELFEQDAARALNEFLKGLNNLQEAGVNIFAILDDVELGSQRVVQALLAASNATGLVAGALSTSARAFEENNALLAEAEKRFATTASKIQLAKNEITDVGIEMGTKLLPIIAEVAGGIGDLISGFENMEGAARFLRDGILLTIVALTTFSTLGKIVARTIGIDLAGALGLAGIKAIALRAAIGGVFAGAIGVAIASLVTFGRRSAEAETLTRNLTDAIIDQTRGLSDNSSEVVRNALTRNIEAFTAIGVSLDTATDAILGNEEAQARLASTLDTAKAKYDAAREAVQFYFENEERANALLEEHNLTLQTASQFVALYDSALSTLGIAQQSFAGATQEARIQLQLLNDQLILEEVEKGAAGLDARISRMQKTLLDAGGTADNVGDSFEDLGDGFEDAADAAQEAVDAFRSLVDEGFGIVDAVDNLSEALIAIQQEGLNPDTALDYAKALNAVERAAADSPGALNALRENLIRQAEAGFLDAQVLALLLNVIDSVAPVSGAAGGALGALEGAIRSEAGVAQAAIGPNLTLLRALGAVNAGIDQTIANLKAFAATVENSADRALLNHVITTVESVSATAKFNAAINAAGVSLGNLGSIAGGGGGGGGGGTAGALNTVADALDTVTNAVRALLDDAGSMDEIIDAQKELNRLYREQANLPDKIRDAERRLKEARKEARKVTLDEQLAIEKAEEALARAKVAFDQGLISATELALAERALEDAINASTAVADNDDVVDAREELKDLREREREIIEDIEDAERAVIDAQLDSIDAQLRLNEAMEAFKNLGDEALEKFRQLAQEAGLSAEQIAGILGLVTGGVSDPGTGDGSKSTREYIVQAGDSLSAIAQRLGVTLERLIRLNATVTNSSTGQTRNLDPGLIFPGDIIKYHRGGIVTGPSGIEQVGALLPGEIILNPSLGQVPQQPILIQNLNVRGVWDMTAPRQVERIMDSVEYELERRRTGRGLPVSRV